VLSSLVIPVLTGKARAHASMSRIPDAQHKCCHAVSRPSEIGGGGRQPRADMRCKTAYPPHDLGTHGAGLRWGIPANPTAGDCSRRTQRVAPASYHDAGSPISPAHLHNAPHPCPLPFAHCHDCLCALGWTCVCAPDASSRPQSTGSKPRIVPHRSPSVNWLCAVCGCVLTAVCMPKCQPLTPTGLAGTTAHASLVTSRCRAGLTRRQSDSPPPLHRPVYRCRVAGLTARHVTARLPHTMPSHGRSDGASPTARLPRAMPCHVAGLTARL